MKCPNCSWPMPEDDLYCHRCGTDNSPPVVEEKIECSLQFKGFLVPDYVQEAFQLVGGERIVGIWRCRVYDDSGVRDNLILLGNDAALPGWHYNENTKIDALTVLTNKRLVLLRESIVFRGLVPTNERSYSLAYALDLSSVVSLVEGGGQVAVQVQTDHGNNRLFLFSKFFKIAPEGPMSGVPMGNREARANLQSLLDNYWKEEEERNNNVQLVMDFSFLKDVLWKGGVALQSAKCPNCGGMVKLPEGGSLVKCDYCGGTLQAVDVLQSLRALLSDIRSG